MQLSIQDTVFCLDYPPHNYTLMVEDPEGNVTDPIVQTSLATGSVIRIVVNDLMEDTRYLYYVVATNQFGSRSLSSVGICKSIIISLYCIHVLSPSLQPLLMCRASLCQVDTTHYSIQCSYLSGSDVSGCVYVLVSREEGVQSEAGFIKRDSYGVTLEVADIGIYSEILAYDITSRNVPSPSCQDKHLPCAMSHHHK